MNNQEGMLAAVSVLRVQGASRPLCPGTPSSSAPTTPGHSLCWWTQPGRSSWHRKSHAQPHQLSLRQSSYLARQGDGDMPEDAPGMGTSTADPALPLPALPDRAAQPGASSVGRMVQHTPAPGQPPTTCQSLSSCSTTQGTQCRTEAGDHSPLRATAATGGLAQAHLQGSLGRKETSQPHGHYSAPLAIPLHD